MPSVVNAIRIVRQMGPEWAWFRLRYACRLKFGSLRRSLPQSAWTDQPLSVWLRPDVPSAAAAYAEWRRQHSPRFFFANIPAGIASVQDTNLTVGSADRILAGRWTYFGHSEHQLGFPPDWHLNPATGQHSSQWHWSQLPDFDWTGDIKFVWEASRFGAVFTLARAYASTGDERYPAAFWALVDDWALHNPPQSGANWKCGQEAAFRLMAWCFGWFAFQSSRSSTPDRLAQLALMMAVHANRIEQNLDYALSQNNNHGLSEAMGLWTVGHLWPEFGRSAVWRCKGKQLLEEQIQRQIFDDGSYIQHSTNYHRLMLHVLLWSFRLGELNADRFSPRAYERFGSAVRFLASITDADSGQAPNYGSNDGALILPLNTCDYSNYRPVLQAGYYLLNQERLFPPGPWDEDLLWLFGPQAVEAASAQQIPRSSSFPDGGYYLLRGPNSWGMVRCARYTTRPVHADQLHFDLWWRGINIACDAGTYLYHGDSPWHNGLARTAVHNTVTVEGLDQMTRASRFLWTDWAQGTACLGRSANGQPFWQGEHNGYLRRIGVLHRRLIYCEGDTWIVVDDLLGNGSHTARVQWLLPDLPYRLEGSRLELETEFGLFSLIALCSRRTAISLVRGGEIISVEAGADPSRGWVSQHYGEKHPALSFATAAAGPLPVRLITVLGRSDRISGPPNEDEFVVHIDRTEVRIPVAVNSPYPAL